MGLTEQELTKLGLFEQHDGTFSKKQPTAPKQGNVATAPKNALFAKGRIKKGEMNKTEAAYDRYLSALKLSGEILWHEFEAITLKLGFDTRLTVDFTVLMPDGTFEFHDTKGHEKIIEEDAKVKMRIAATKFPFPFFYVFPIPEKQGGGWRKVQVGKI
jgi:hypothetical protein